MRESEAKFRQLVDNIADTLWIRSADMRELHYVSPAYTQIWERSVESLYANPQLWVNFVFPEDRELVKASFAAFMRGGTNPELDYRIMRPGGEICWVKIRRLLVRDANAEVIRIAGIVTDIAERKEAEAVRVLLGEQLRESQKPEAIVTFAAGIAHDFNNILATILGNVKLAREDVCSSP